MALAFTDGSGWVQVGYLIKILEENYRRYEQLREILSRAKSDADFLRSLHSGLDSVSGLMQGLDIDEPESFRRSRNAGDALANIQELYQRNQKSGLRGIFTQKDRDFGETLAYASQMIGVAEQFERNAQRLFAEAPKTSPKGAQRANVQSNAQILDAMAKSVKLSAAQLRLQTQALAVQNSEDRDQVEDRERVTASLLTAQKSLNTSFALAKF